SGAVEARRHSGVDCEEVWRTCAGCDRGSGAGHDPVSGGTYAKHVGECAHRHLRKRHRAGRFYYAGWQVYRDLATTGTERDAGGGISTTAKNATRVRRGRYRGVRYSRNGLCKAGDPAAERARGNHVSDGLVDDKVVGPREPATGELNCFVHFVLSGRRGQ